jgi:acyl carrier protein
MTIEQAIAVVEEHSGQKVTAETKISDLGFDSLDFLDLMVALGIPDERVPHIDTVQDLAA